MLKLHPNCTKMTLLLVSFLFLSAREKLRQRGSNKYYVSPNVNQIVIIANKFTIKCDLHLFLFVCLF